MEKSIPSRLSKKDIAILGASTVLGPIGTPFLAPLIIVDSGKSLRKLLKKDIKHDMEQDVTTKTQKEITGLANTIHNQTGSDIKKEKMPDLQTQRTQPDRAETSNVVTQKPKVISQNTDYRFANPWELDAINNGSSDSDKIHLFEATTPTAKYYVIEDKINHTATVYRHGKSILIVDTATGEKKGDALTVTTKNGKGNNMSTPAGMFRIGSTSIYHGKPAFQRSKIYEDYDIPSSVHVGDVPRDKTKCNISNGCTRISGESADKLNKYVTIGSRWYILPEEEKTGKFKITGSGISFVSNDPQKLHSEHARGTRNMTIKIPEELSGNKTLEAAVKSLEGSKGIIMDRIGISSDTYDKLALLTLGLMGRESGYGEPTGPRGKFGLLKDEIFGGVLGQNVSAGAFQIKATSVPKPLVKKLTGDVKIDYDSLIDPSTSAQYALLLLFDIYKNQAPKFRNKYPDLSLEEITLAYYTNPAGVKNPEKHQMRIPYAREVLKNASKFKLNYQLPKA